jgi:hypothetical protein
MDDKNKAEIIDLSIRVFCLEKILLEKKIITKEEFEKEFNSAAEMLVRNVLKAANYSGDIEEAVSQIKNNKKSIN